MSAPFYFQIIGGIGAFLVLFGFYRTSIGKWTSKSFWYELDNLIGATLLVIYGIRLHAFMGVVINVVWFIVALKGLSSFTQRRQKSKKHK